jgi:hypothetical protein
MAVLPSISNLLLYRTFKAITHHKQKKEIDFQYSPVDSETLASVDPPTNYDELEVLEDVMDHDDKPIDSEYNSYPNRSDSSNVVKTDKFELPAERRARERARDGLKANSGKNNSTKRRIKSASSGSDDDHEHKDDSDSDTSVKDLTWYGPKIASRRKIALITNALENRIILEKNGFTLPPQELKSVMFTAATLSTGLTLLTNLINSTSGSAKVKAAVAKYTEAMGQDKGFFTALTDALTSMISGTKGEETHVKLDKMLNNYNSKAIKQENEVYNNGLKAFNKNNRSQDKNTSQKKKQNNKHAYAIDIPNPKNYVRPPPPVPVAPDVLLTRSKLLKVYRSDKTEPNFKALKSHSIANGLQKVYR